jgi:hypothetical protein
MAPASTTPRPRPSSIATSPSAPATSGDRWGRCSTISLKDVFANHTHLQQVKRNGDLVIEGEITQYSQRNKSVSSEGYSAQTELSMTVNVRFHQQRQPQVRTSRRSSPPPRATRPRRVSPAYRKNSWTQMCKDLTDQIFNATVANW